MPCGWLAPGCSPTRTTAGPVWNGQVRFNEGWLDQPLRWGRPRMIFVCAHADLFHDSVPDEWIDRVFAIMAASPLHTFQVLTKRAERMQRYLSDPRLRDNIISAAALTMPVPWTVERRMGNFALPLPNVWMGVSAEDQPRADERIHQLIATPAAGRWGSAEPLLGSIWMATNGRFNDGDGAYNWLTGDRFDVDVDANGVTGGSHKGPRIDGGVAGGESGPRARDVDTEAFYSLRDQCKAAGVAFFMKQMPHRTEIPADLMVREYPA